MHSINLIDPTSSPFICLEGFSPPDWGPQIYSGPWFLGPLTWQCFSIEEIDSSGRRMKFDNFTENSFKHFYAEGSIYHLPVNQPFLWWVNQGWIPFTKGYDYDLRKDQPTPGCLDRRKLFSKWSKPVKKGGFWHLDIQSTWITTSYMDRDNRDHDFIRTTIKVTAKRRQDVHSGMVQVYDVRATMEYEIDAGNGVYRHCDMNVSMTEMPCPQYLMCPTIDREVVKSSIQSVLSLMTNSRNALCNFSPSGWTSHRDQGIYDAMNNMEVANINWIESIKDTMDLKAMVRPIFDLIKLRRHPETLFKALAGLHLWWRYCLKTNIMSLKEFEQLIAFLKVHGHDLLQWVRTQDLFGHGKSDHFQYPHPMDKSIEVDEVMYMKIRTSAASTDFEAWCAQLHFLKFTPSLYDLWDLVPLSFVVDWALPVGDIIRNMETMSFIQNMKVRVFILTREQRFSFERTVSLPSSQLVYDLNCVQYKRSVCAELPHNMWLGVFLTDPRKQWYTATALALSMWK